ncbi:MAG: fatty acid desaturase, partial [Gammaproteobacteria bacterium]|nr:fatty acid desaturase [Gammaproteobacteria bacterium]
YPATRASMRRKLIRDCTGQTGLKDVKQQFSKLGWRRNAPFLASHGTLLAVLALAGIPWAYLLWWVAYLIVYQVVVRIRFISEHGVAANRLSKDPRDNTCTTLISWWERLLIGPNFVNYHLEHHLHAGVPCYRLRAFHRRLQTRGYFASARSVSHGYAEVLRRAVQPA